MPYGGQGQLGTDWKPDLSGINMTPPTTGGAADNEAPPDDPGTGTDPGTGGDPGGANSGPLSPVGTPTGTPGSFAHQAAPGSLRAFRTPGFLDARTLFGSNTGGVPIVGVGGAPGDGGVSGDMGDDERRQRAMVALLSSFFTK